MSTNRHGGPDGDPTLRVHNLFVSRDGFGAGEGQSLERPFGHADPVALGAWAFATDSWPNRTEPGGSRGLGDYMVCDFHRNIGAEIMGRDVWDAITNPARLADWWLPFDADITVDLREGGEMVFAGRGEESVTMTCTILRIEPPMLLEHTHADASYLRWELEPVDTGCVLRLSHFVTDTARAIDNSYVVGLHASLARLEPCLAGRPVAWDWHGFAEAQAHYATIGLAPPPDAS